MPAADPFLGFATDALRFDKLLGKGGMGAVYLGEQLRMNRTVAIKVIASHLVADPKYIERFTREAQMLGRLVHPNIIACHDYGPASGPRGEALYVMVLEYIDGWSLGGLARQKRLTVRQVLDLYRQAAEGLAFAHRLGVVHRDIKPDNLLITRTGTAKIADFGLARSEDSVQVTQTGSIIGSPAYMAPEACRGEEPTFRSDIYSLGCALFQTLTDQPPYTGQSTLQVLNQHISEPMPNLLALRPDLVRLQPVLARCLAKRPHERWPTCDSLAQALAAEGPFHADDVVAGRLLRAPSGSRQAAVTVLTGAVATVQETHPGLTGRGPTSGSQRGWYVAMILALVVILGAGWLMMPTPPVVDLPVAPTPPLPGSDFSAITTPAANSPQVGGILVSDIDRILDSVAEAAEAGTYAEANGRLITLVGILPIEQLPAAQRQRIQQLSQLVTEKLTNTAKTLPPPAVSPIPKTTAGTVMMLKPLRGDAVSGRLLPDQAPLGPQAILRSVNEDGGQGFRLRLPTPLTAGEHDGVAVMVGSDTQQRVAVLASGGGQTFELGSFTVAERGWTVNVLPLKTGAVITELGLRASSGPFLLVSAVVRTGAQPTVRDLAIFPGTLTVSRELHRSCETVISHRADFPLFQRVRVIIPQSLLTVLPRIDLLATLNRGLLTVGGVAPASGSDVTLIPDSALRTYTGAAELSTELDAIGDPHLLFVYLPATLPRLALHLLRPDRFLDKGTLPVLILGPDSARQGRVREFMLENNKRSLQALLDLSNVPAFYQSQGLQLEVADPAYGKQLLGGLEAGLRQLRDRLQGISEGFNRKLDKSR